MFASLPGVYLQLPSRPGLIAQINNISPPCSFCIAERMYQIQTEWTQEFSRPTSVLSMRNIVVCSTPLMTVPAGVGIASLSSFRPLRRNGKAAQRTSDDCSKARLVGMLAQSMLWLRTVSNTERDGRLLPTITLID